MSDPGRASMFGLWSAVNPTVAWLIARHPEVLVYTPREFQSGIKRRPRLARTPDVPLSALVTYARSGAIIDLDWRQGEGWRLSQL